MAWSGEREEERRGESWTNCTSFSKYIGYLQSVCEHWMSFVCLVFNSVLCPFFFTFHPASRFWQHLGSWVLGHLLMTGRVVTWKMPENCVATSHSRILVVVLLFKSEMHLLMDVIQVFFCIQSYWILNDRSAHRCTSLVAQW